jgi:hypothetical protein
VICWAACSSSPQISIEDHVCTGWQSSGYYLTGSFCPILLYLSFCLVDFLFLSVSTEVLRIDEFAVDVLDPSSPAIFVSPSS